MRLLLLIVGLMVVLHGAAGYPNFLSELEDFKRGYNGTVSAAIGGHFVPSDPALVQSRWTGYREAIRDMIGSLQTGETPQSIQWRRNSANSAHGLSSLATSFIPQFKALMLGAVARVPDSYATFGPNDRFITKSLKSIEEKEARLQVDGNADPIGTIDDALRGTLVVARPEDLRLIIDAFADSALEQGVEYTLSNSWRQNRASGYTGVHAKVYLQNGPAHNILAEAQFHLGDLFDGTLECPKEFTHGIYEVTRTLVLDEPANAAELQTTGDVAQKFVFLFGLQRACVHGCARPTERAIVPLGDDDTRVYYAEGFLIRVDSADLAPLMVSVWTPPINDWVPQGNYSFLWQERLDEAYPVSAELLPKLQAKLARIDGLGSAASLSAAWLALLDYLHETTQRVLSKLY